MSEYKYDKNCKYCLENNITKQKIFIESMIKDKNNEIKENKINLENSNKYIKSQKEIKDKYDDYINKIDLINNTRNEIEDINKNIELIWNCTKNGCEYTKIQTLNKNIFGTQKCNIVSTSNINKTKSFKFKLDPITNQLLIANTKGETMYSINLPQII